jgi:hypothetical protein
MNDNELKSILRKINASIRITKVVATRSVKGKGGDTYAGFSAAWNSTQDDAGGGIEGLLDGDEAQGGMTIKEARIAHLMVAMQADISAHDAALAGGNVSNAYHRDAVRAIKANYTRMIREILSGPTKITEE